MAVVLKKGSKGADVKALQEALNKSKPPPKPPLKIDGIWGPKTDAAFKDYQKKNKLKVDGKAGPKAGAAFLKMPGGAVGKKIAEKLGGAEPAPDPKGGGGEEEKPVKDRMLKPSYFERMIKLLKAGNELTFGFGIGSGDDSTHKFMMSDELDTGKKAFSRIKIEFKCTKGGGGKVKQLSKTRLELKCEKPIPGLKTKMKGLCASNERMPWTGFVILGPDGKELDADEETPKDEEPEGGKKTPAKEADDAPKDVDPKVADADKTWLKTAIDKLDKAGYDGVADLLEKFEALGDLPVLLAAPAIYALKKLVEAALDAWEKHCQAEFDEKLKKEVVPALTALKKEVDALTKAKADTKPFKGTLTKLTKTVDALKKDKKMSWSDKLAALDKVKKAAEDETMDAQVRAMKPGDKKTGEKIKKLVEKRFNVKFNFKLEGGAADLEKEGATLKQLYETLAKAPVWPGDKLKKLNVTVLEETSLTGEGGVYNSGDNRAGVTCKRPDGGSLNYGNQLGADRYFPDGVEDSCKPANNDPVDYFSWATLHEVGHALDAQTGFMNNNQSKSEYGGWTDYGTAVDPIAKVAAKHFGKGLKADEVSNLEKYAKTQMVGGAAPAHKSDKEKAAREKVAEWVAAIKADKSIWWKGAECNKRQIGNIVYLEAYAGRRWVSYELKARKQGIHGYQFRAPGEWFAELYAAYYSDKLKKNHPFVDELKKLEK